MLRLIDQEDQTPEIPAPRAFNTSAMEVDMGEVAGPWSGRPGQFSGKGSLQNGLDALNKAGASLAGFLSGSKNDIELVRKFYSKNPDVANQYDLPVNLTLRYLSGVGDKGLKVSPEQGKQVLKAIKASRNKGFDERIAVIEKLMKPEIAASYKQKVSQGIIPVDINEAFQGERNKELSHSLGRFWAKPLRDGSYEVTDDFNFEYAPSNKGGNDARARARNNPAGNLASYLSINPADHVRRLVSQGSGAPFQYTLIIAPDGTVKVVPKELQALRINR